MRHLYMVLSPKSLPYSYLALESLFRNLAEPFRLRLITDSFSDSGELRRAIDGLALPAASVCEILHENQLADLEAERFAGRPNLRAFRHGHPCWRKVTDPLLIAEPAQEMVLLDPDLYFPGKFRFEATPDEGLLLMWQEPNCLLPPETVQAAMSAGLALANHVDIGVAHWRNAVDLEWIDWMLGQLGGPDLPRVMHVEAIVWSAILMRLGGGHLDPGYWKCWRNTQWGRMVRKLGVSGAKSLRSEPWQRIKCFHAGGEAKWWLPDAIQNIPAINRAEPPQPGRTIAAVALSVEEYERGLAMRRLLRKLGYYRLMK